MPGISFVTVNGGSHRSEFVYDASRRRARVIEKEAGATQSDVREISCESAACELRASDGSTVLLRRFPGGEQVAGLAQFVALDHLGSVHTVTDNGVTLLAGYSFDPWGDRTLAAGTDVTVLGYTGYQWHTYSETWTAPHRVYRPTIARWISEDPVGLADGPNMFAYVQNAPTVNIDPLGLSTAVCCRRLNPILMKFARHCYIKTDSHTYGLHNMHNGSGQKRRDDPSDKGGKCKPCESKCEDGDATAKCIQQQHDNYPDPSRYSNLGPNSNTYAGTLARACCKGGMPGGLGNHPGSNDPPPN